MPLDTIPLWLDEMAGRVASLAATPEGRARLLAGAREAAGEELSRLHRYRSWEERRRAHFQRRRASTRAVPKGAAPSDSMWEWFQRRAADGSVTLGFAWCPSDLLRENKPKIDSLWPGCDRPLDESECCFILCALHDAIAVDANPLAPLGEDEFGDVLVRTLYLRLVRAFRQDRVREPDRITDRHRPTLQRVLQRIERPRELPPLAVREQEVWDAIASAPMTSDEIARAIGTCAESVRGRIARMRKKGYAIAVIPSLGYSRRREVTPT